MTYAELCTWFGLFAQRVTTFLRGSSARPTGAWCRHIGPKIAAADGGIARNTVRAAPASDRPAKYERAPREKGGRAFELQFDEQLRSLHDAGVATTGDRLDLRGGLSVASSSLCDGSLMRGRTNFRSANVGVIRERVASCQRP